MELDVFFRNPIIWNEMPNDLQLRDGEDEVLFVEKLLKRVGESPLWFYLKNLSLDELKVSIGLFSHQLEVAVLLKEIYLLFDTWFTNIKYFHGGTFLIN